MFRSLSGRFSCLSHTKDRLKKKLGEEKYLYIRNAVFDGFDGLHRGLHYGAKTFWALIIGWLKFPSRKKKVLGVVNWEPISLYLQKGYLKSQLDEYYNPCGYFDSVHIFAYRDDNFDISSKVHIHGFSDNKSADELTYLCRKYRVKILRNYHVYWSHLLTLEVKKRLKIPAVISLHDSFFYDTIAGYDHIFAYVEWLVDEMKKKLGVDNISLLLNRIDQRLFKPLRATDLFGEFGVYDNKIVSASRLHEGHKNFSTVIRAMRKVVDKYPSTILCIMGEGRDKELYLNMIEDLQLRNNIKVIPFQKQSKVVEYLDRADFFVLVNNSGDIGKATAEALMVGKPVVATGGKGNSALHLRDGFNARLVPWEKHKDPDAVAEAVIYMIEHRAEFDTKAIREDAIKVYNYDYWMREEVSAYKRLMRQRYGYE